MFKRTFDSKLRYRVAVYLRMSSEQQNKRSPEQQLAEIRLRLKRLGLSWEIVHVYRDDAKSGRYLKKRTGYQQMLSDIKLGRIQVDLILVDNFERFGRVEELPIIRKELLEKSGVLVLTADTNFADPTTPQGKALGMLEAYRAVEDGRTKAHGVLRGKRDAVMQKQWPGGPAPFGFMLESIMKVVKGCQEVDHRILVPRPETAPIMQGLFEQAAETGWGQTRLARWLNEDPEIPAKYKPFQAATVGYWLDNPIYVGDLLWAEHCTDVVDDRRVIKKNAAEDVVLVPDFCQPLISRDVYDKIQLVRNARRAQIAESRSKSGEPGFKLIEPLAPGLTLKYLLSGLVRCGHCGRAMNPSSGPRYVTKDGEEKRYTAYVCQGYIERVCPNRRRIPESWLRQAVIDQLRLRFFSFLQ